jgi:hypothetical protein
MSVERDEKGGERVKGGMLCGWEGLREGGGREEGDVELGGLHLANVDDNV